jgi:hypothetical protein
MNNECSRESEYRVEKSRWRRVEVGYTYIIIIKN